MQFQDQEVPTPEENEVIDQPTTEVEVSEVDDNSDFDEVIPADEDDELDDEEAEDEEAEDENED